MAEVEDDARSRVTLDLYISTATMSHQFPCHAGPIYILVLSHIENIVVHPVTAEVTLDGKLIRGPSRRVDQDGGNLGLLGTASS